MFTFVIIVTSIAQFLLSLFVLIRGRRNLSYILFFCMGIASLCWALVNYFAIFFIDSPNLIYIVRSILFLVVIQNTFFYLFARAFPNLRWTHSKKWLLAYLGLSVTAAAATLSPFVFVSVTIENGLPATQAGPGILIFIAHAFTSIFFAFRAFMRKRRRARGTTRTQFDLLLLASFLNWIIVPITNFLITPVYKTTFFIEAGPIYTLLFASIIAYAIISQKLFDIRFAVARGVAYVLSLGFLALIYGLPVFVVSALLSAAGIELGVVERWLYIGFALITALLFPTIRNYFSRLTNKIFYQDIYEPQNLLNDLNSSLVSLLDIEPIIKNTALLLEHYIKPEFVAFYIDNPKSSSHQPGQVFSTNSLGRDRTEAIYKFAKEFPSGVVEFPLSEGVSAKQKQMATELNVEVIARLPALEKDKNPVGSIVFGQKKSSNTYNSQDIKTLKIISDELVIAIQNALRFEEIQQFNITLQEKVDDATKQLRNANEKLIALDQSKDEFISMASHQLRTPLTSVKGYVSMVLEGDVGKITAGQRKLLDQAYLSSQRMVYLIADLLNVSRLKTGKFIIEAQPTNLADLVATELEQLQETAASRKLTLEYDKPKDFPVLNLDDTKIRQVVMNFADNAIYYTPAGGHIKVAVTDTGESIEFTVTDDGIGVPKSEQHNLFNKFYRAGNAKKARPDGTGLGLFMAKKVVIAQGGNIIFKTKEGKGSTFGFSFEKKKLQSGTHTVAITEDNDEKT